MRQSSLNSHFALGRSFLPAVIGVVVLAIIVWLALQFFASEGPSRQVVSEQAPAAPVETLTDTQELLKSARAAVGDQRIVQPKDDNALELYLRVLELEPNNTSAKTALLELMPYATDSADRLIASGDYDGAQRAIELLNRADPGSTVIETLAGRLQRTRANAEAQVLAQEDAARAAEENRRRTEEQRVAEQQAARDAAADPTPAPAVATTPEPAAPAQPRPTPAAPAPAPTPAAPVAATPAPTPAAAQRNANFELIKAVPASYPPRALRAGVQGWVDVEFTITATGDVSDAKVVASQPRREFDREALRAVQQYKFKPRVENGRPVPAAGRQRVEFKLNG